MCIISLCYLAMRLVRDTVKSISLSGVTEQLCVRNITGAADKSLARPSRCLLFDGENISFDASLVIYIVLIFLQLRL